MFFWAHVTVVNLVIKSARTGKRAPQGMRSKCGRQTRERTVEDVYVMRLTINFALTSSFTCDSIWTIGFESNSDEEVVIW